MSFIESTKDKLVAVSPRTLVQRLAAQYRGKPWSEGRPLVTLVNAHNLSMQGHIVDVQEKSNERTVLFKIEMQHSPFQNELVYLSLDHVIGGIVHGAERYADLLTEGGVAKPRSTPAPTQLELKRIALHASEKTKLAVVFSEGSESIPPSESARGNAASVLEAIPKAFTRLLADEIGKKALDGVKTLALAHTAGTEPSVSKTKDKLRFVADFESAFPEDTATWLEKLFASAL